METKLDLQYNVSTVYSTTKDGSLLKMKVFAITRQLILFFSFNSVFPPSFSTMGMVSLYNKTTIICEVSKCCLFCSCPLNGLERTFVGG